ncbi:bifunctional diguanylate cyclase/phosphodiesterase [Psychrobacillus sp. OK032]|uniref:sensor domain-containing protein n=1 Tax=Psychrobacillus sp. OK032 TaxID=1884358 RepID=UPI0008D86BB6|nr:bifunctional diguanylate cyclase/phosphodiesterase [Psychrobacillus sp. OK032]SER99469.1 diguanylate cyclase/phosphodiesterase [Psychrobacillus sp. OK032]
MERNYNANFLHQSLFEYNPDIVYFSNTSGTLEKMNEVFFQKLGFTYSYEINTIDSLLPSNFIQMYKEAFYKVLSGTPQNFNIKFIHKMGHIMDINLTMMPAYLDGLIHGAFGIAKDITDHMEAVKLNTYLANYDSLTGLPNRRLFQEKLEQAIIVGNTLNQKVAVMYLDLDRFKYINDTLGHTLGDQLLIQIANRLNYCLVENAVIARLGGDEFGVLLTNFYTQQAKERSKSIIESLDEPFLVENYNLFVTTSIGISIYPHDGEDSLTLMKNADSALYKAKELGKNNFQVFSSSLNAQTYKIFSLESSLRKAIELGQFELYYQPKICPSTYEIVGAEALIRWNHPEWGLVSPDEFIPLAEETGLHIEIGAWVKRTACTQNKSWQEAGLPKVPVSINLSANRFLEKSLITNVIEILEETKLESQYLEIEITESSLLENEKVVFSVLEELKSLGIKVSLDDFGTGYSSLSSLKRFKGLIEVLKIDRTFINDLTPKDTADSNFITKMIIQLSQQLNMKVVAEGVETVEQLKVLSNYNCDLIQGYLFSKPVSATEFEKLLRKGILMPEEMNSIEHKFTDYDKNLRIILENPLKTTMTLTQIRGNKVELGTMDVLIEEIQTKRLQFLSNIKLAVNNEIILELKTEILSQLVNFVGTIISIKEPKPNVFQYVLEYKMEKSELANITTALDKFGAALHEPSLVSKSSFIQADRYAFFNKV